MRDTIASSGRSTGWFATWSAFIWRGNVFRTVWRICRDTQVLMFVPRSRVKSLVFSRLGVWHHHPGDVQAFGLMGATWLPAHRPVQGQRGALSPERPIRGCRCVLSCVYVRSARSCRLASSRSTPFAADPSNFGQKLAGLPADGAQSEGKECLIRNRNISEITPRIH